MPEPARLPPNPVRRFYRGGPAIAALRGEAAGPADVPEDWVGSTTEAFGEPGVGLSPLPDGTLLRDAVAADPQGWLGPAHVARWGADPLLLVKLLDAGERLPVHVHPDGPYARAHLDAGFGKTEAWVVAGGSGSLWLGWREPVALEELRGWVDAQDAEAMLAACNRMEVGPGDAYFVPAGVAHAIGEGLLIVECQEPSDMSVLTEWRGHGVAGEEEATLGLGWETALACVRLEATDVAALRSSGSVPPPAADPFFRADELRPDALLDQGFAILLVLDGAVALGGALELERGAAAVVPHGAGAVRLEGDGRVLRCRPPDPAVDDPPAR